jgi:hypothetical protein
VIKLGIKLERRVWGQRGGLAGDGAGEGEGREWQLLARLEAVFGSGGVTRKRKSRLQHVRGPATVRRELKRIFLPEFERETEDEYGDERVGILKKIRLLKLVRVPCITRGIS